MDQLIRLYRYLFSSSKFYRINRFLFKLSLRGIGVLNFENRNVSGELFVINNILPKLLTSDKPIFFDVGANIGEYTSDLKRRFPDSIIYSFEPHPDNYLKLKRKKEKNIELLNIGLGETSGKYFLYDLADADGTSRASQYHEVFSLATNEQSKKFEIIITTLNEFTTSNNIQYIDFIKIDTEGSELAVLKGASNLLAENRIGCIQFEFNEMNTVSRVFFRDFADLLEGYEFYRLLPNSIVKLDNSPVYNEIFAFQNILAVPSKFNLDL